MQKLFVLQASKKLTAAEISAVTGAAIGTIQICYKDLFPFARSLVPQYFASDADISTLPHP